MSDRIRLNVWIRDFASVPDCPAEDGIYQTGHAIVTMFLCQFNGFVHRRMIRHTVKEKQLIKTQPQDLNYLRLELLQFILMDELTHHPIQIPAPPYCAINQLCEERFVRVHESLLPDGSIQYVPRSSPSGA